MQNMKLLCYFFLFCWCSHVYSIPPVIQYILKLFPFYNTESIEAVSVPLSSELKIYLEGKIEGKTASESVATFSISDLTDLSYCNYWCEKCWRLQKVELEQILYKFYTNEECPCEKTILRFLNFCLNTYEHKKEKEYFPDLKILSIIHKERLLLNKVIATM